MKVPESKETFWQSSEYDFWKIVLDTLLAQTLWKEKQNTSLVIFKENEYANFLEECVSWEFANMRKEVFRKPNRKIAEIQFLIGNVTVITLKSHYATYYINILNNWYSFYGRETLSKRLFQFLRAFPAFYKEGIAEYRKFSQNINKQYKMRQITQDSIRIVIDKMMKENGYLYYLKFQRSSCVLTVKMKKKQVLEISLPYKTFANRLGNIIETIKLVEETISASKIRFNLKGSGCFLGWNSVKK